MNQKLTRMRVIWGAMVMSHVVFAVVAVAVTRSMAGNGENAFPAVFGIVFAGLGLGGIAISVLMRNLLAGRAERSENPSNTRFQSMIVGLALTDFASSLGLVHAILTGGLNVAVVLFAAAFVAAIWHFPLDA